MEFDKIINGSYDAKSAYIEKINELYNSFKEEDGELFLKFPARCLEEIKSNDVEKRDFPEVIFNLLHAYEIKFLKTGTKENYPKVYYQIYYCFFIIYKNWDIEGAYADTKPWIQKKWLTVCFNTLSDKNLKFWLESHIIDPESQIKVEENVKCILFDKQNGDLKTEFKRKDGEGRLKRGKEGEMVFYASRAIDWFLKRYDWKSALYIARESNRSTIITYLLPTVLFMLNIFFVFSLVSRTISSGSGIFVSSKSDSLDFAIIKGTPYYVEYVLTGLFIIGVIVVIILAIVRGFEFVRFFLPRLLGSVFIGFLPLVAGPDMYAFPLKVTWMQVSVISVLFILIAFLYLSLECYNITGKVGLFWRTSGVILYGLLASFIMSLFVCDIAAVHFINYSGTCYHLGYKGFFGIIYPKVVLFYAPAALLIGIFIQIFWEEKTITEPL